MWTLEIASILPSHWDFSYELHEDPDFVRIILLKKLLISSKLFIRCKGVIHFSSLRLHNSIQFLNTSPIRIGLGLVFVNLCSEICENLLFLSSKKNPDLHIFWVATWFFSAAWTQRTKFMHGSHGSCMTDRQGLSWQQTFFKRVISLSSVRWFFSLLSEQWWRERSADGLVVEFRVKQVQGYRVAGLLLEENFSCLWVVEIVKDVGLITCERGDFGQGPDSSVGGVPVGYCTDGGHMEEEVQLKVQVEEERTSETHEKEQSEEQRVKERTTAHCGWPFRRDDAHQHILEPCSVMCNNYCVFTAWENDVWSVLFTDVDAIINKSAGAKNGWDCSANTGLPVLVWRILYSSHKSETAP